MAGRAWGKRLRKSPPARRSRGSISSGPGGLRPLLPNSSSKFVSGRLMTHCQPSVRLTQRYLSCRSIALPSVTNFPLPLPPPASPPAPLCSGVYLWCCSPWDVVDGACPWLARSLFSRMFVRKLALHSRVWSTSLFPGCDFACESAFSCLDSTFCSQNRSVNNRKSLGGEHGSPVFERTSGSSSFGPVMDDPRRRHPIDFLASYLADTPELECCSEELPRRCVVAAPCASTAIFLQTVEAGRACTANAGTGTCVALESRQD